MLGVSKSTGLDGLPAGLKKVVQSFLKHLLLYLLMYPLLLELFQRRWNLPEWDPFKRINPLDVSNYRAVSILNIVSKILERSIFFQLNKFLTKNNLLYEYQSGFRSRYSTDTCLTHLLDYTKGNNPRGLYTRMIMLDLQKAFDTAEHVILCTQKIEGIGVISIEWLKSYLSGRQQVVAIDGITSCPGLVTCGGPQGSILGPLLFLC